MKRAPRSRQRHDLYAKYHDCDSEISDLLGECGHISLRAKALKMVQVVDTLDELNANLEALRDGFPDPDSMSNLEVRGIAEWVWKLRLENRIYEDRNSAVKIDRMAIDALLMEPDALVLYVTLCDAHGHIPAKRFALSHPGMVKSKRIALSRDRFRAARDTLVKKGLLQMVTKHQAGKRSQQFILCRLPPVGQEQQNVTRIQFS